MPQGKLPSRASVGAPERETYARKKDSSGQHRSLSFAPSNPNFKAALPTMIRNAEMLAAGKLAQEGRVLL